MREPGAGPEHIFSSDLIQGQAGESEDWLTENRGHLDRHSLPEGEQCLGHPPGGAARPPRTPSMALQGSGTQKGRKNHVGWKRHKSHPGGGGRDAAQVLRARLLTSGKTEGVPGKRATLQRGAQRQRRGRALLPDSCPGWGVRGPSGPALTGSCRPSPAPIRPQARQTSQAWVQQE